MAAGSWVRSLRCKSTAAEDVVTTVAALPRKSTTTARPCAASGRPSMAAAALSSSMTTRAQTLLGEVSAGERIEAPLSWRDPRPCRPCLVPASPRANCGGHSHGGPAPCRLRPCRSQPWQPRPVLAAPVPTSPRGGPASCRPQQWRPRLVLASHHAGRSRGGLALCRPHPVPASPCAPAPVPPRSGLAPCSSCPWSKHVGALGNLYGFWGLNSHPPGGFLSFFTNTSSHTQGMGNGTSSQPINVGNDTNGDGYARTEKRLTWTKEEDLRLVSAWLNNSNDPIQSNYKKNEQYWKEVAAVYNSTTPKNRARLVKQVKDRFGRIKKKVAWFCASWKEANALYASGESDVDLKKRAMQTYEEDHKEDGPFMFEHCWEFLKSNQMGRLFGTPRRSRARKEKV
ncbi:hypothetical protein ACQ4PT_056594 [Festuca glaucescens]